MRPHCHLSDGSYNNVGSAAFYTIFFPLALWVNMIYKKHIRVFYFLLLIYMRTTIVIIKIKLFSLIVMTKKVTLS